MLRRLEWMTAGCVVALLVTSALRAQQSAVQPPGSVIVVVNHADGRRQPITVGPTSGGMYTAAFVRVPGWTAPADKMPVTAINFVCARDPEGVKVAISVYRGSPHQQEDPIKTVLVTPKSPVVIHELRDVGLQPVTLTLSDVMVPVLVAPTVVIASPKITAEVTVEKEPVARYIVRLRNHSDTSVRWADIETMRAGVRATSGSRQGPEGGALIAAGDEFVFVMTIPAGRPAPDGSVTLAPTDRINISAIVWSDGSFDGDPERAVIDLTWDVGVRAQLSRMLAEFQKARSAGSAATVASLREALTNLPVDASDAMIEDARAHVPPAPTMTPSRTASALRGSQADIRMIALRDLAAFESSPAGSGNFQAWLNTTSDRYLRWFTRLGGR